MTLLLAGLWLLKLLFRFPFVVILLRHFFGFALDGFLLRLAFQGFQFGEGRYRAFPDDTLTGPLLVTVMSGATAVGTSVGTSVPVAAII